MNSEMATYLVIGVVLGIIIGIIFTNVMSPKARKYNRVKRELDETQQELTNQKQIIVKHFSHSAEILDNMAQEFRRLYQHMAENSSHLISEEDLKKAQVIETDLINEDKSETSTTQQPAPPKDYSGNPSGLLKNDDKN